MADYEFVGFPRKLREDRSSPREEWTWLCISTVIAGSHEVMTKSREPGSLFLYLILHNPLAYNLNLMKSFDSFPLDIVVVHFCCQGSLSGGLFHVRLSVLFEHL